VLVKVFEITSGSVHVVCDNEQALRVFHPDFLPNPDSEDFDLLNALWYLIGQSPLTWTYEHVYGHQDSKRRRGRPLTRLEKLNVLMDKTAGDVWVQAVRQQGQSRNVFSAILGEGWQLWNGQDKLTCPSRNCLYELIQDEATQMWWVRHGFVSQDNAARVDWDATSDLMAALTPAERRWITKTASHNCGIGTTLVQWKYQDDPQCPRCGQREDSAHVVRCTGHEANVPWEQSMQDLKAYLEASKTSPSIAVAIPECIQLWRNQQPIVPATFPPDIRSTVAEQHSIGWQSLLEGLPSGRWRRVQLQFVVRQRLRQSNKRWMTGLLKKLVALGRGQWFHRNQMKHVTLRPRHKRAEALLNQEIMELYNHGPVAVSIGDRGLFQENLVRMLDRSLPYRKAWFVNVTTAITRQQRIVRHDPTYSSLTPTQTTVIQWIQEGRSS
jgi:hypothetical protein